MAKPERRLRTQAKVSGLVFTVGSFTSFGAFGRLALELDRLVRVESGKPKLGCLGLGVLLFAS